MKLNYMVNTALHVKQRGQYKLIRADIGCFKMQGKIILSIPLKDVSIRVLKYGKYFYNFK